jgi:hypothetical protein
MCKLRIREKMQQTFNHITGPFVGMVFFIALHYEILKINLNPVRL